MQSRQLRELKAEFESLMGRMRDTDDLQEKLALLDQASLIIDQVNAWIKQSNKQLKEIGESLLPPASRSHSGMQIFRV